MSRRFVLAVSFLLSSVLVILTTSCGGGSSNGNTGGAVSIAISPTTATVPANGTQQFQATVTGSSNTADQWQVNGVTGGKAASGTISNSGLFTAPSTGVALQVTVSAVASADSTKVANAAVTVNALPSGSVTISPTSATVGAGGTQQFTATIVGGSDQRVSWSVDGVSGGNNQVGTVSSSGLYTAPGSAGNHTVTATSVADTSKSASAAVGVILLTVSPHSASL